ncbi:hypothetical protein, partial [Pelagicoccus mobilis]|uniref:hypothetical protein n=1 Tax=Pelagicoccus mobilis TaxID=415221 RepID=UPI001F2E3916
DSSPAHNEQGPNTITKQTLNQETITQTLTPSGALCPAPPVGQGADLPPSKRHQTLPIPVGPLGRHSNPNIRGSKKTTSHQHSPSI